ncbi:MAG: glycosyltransferase family protein [Burkholderiales bacterium]|nr:glycosyltransferase family protein [Burkholderiales bacterium]
MKAIAIVQARMASTRLPGKVLADIAGKPMLAWLIQRVSATPGIEKIIVATTDNADDDVLADWVTNVAGLACYRGSEQDVLDRYYRCARLYRSDLIVRVTADDPLKDPTIIQKAIDSFDATPTLDYCSNTIKPTYPEGLDIEVFRHASLERAWRESTLPSEREHVTPYIWKNASLFSVENFEYGRDLSSWRWTVDKPNDIEFMNKVLGHFKNDPLVNFEAVIRYLELDPALARINAGTIRNEGYLKSMNEEMR